jgi:hypothetical protein
LTVATQNAKRLGRLFHRFFHDFSHGFRPRRLYNFRRRVPAAREIKTTTLDALFPACFYKADLELSAALSTIFFLVNSPPERIGGWAAARFAVYRVSRGGGDKPPACGLIAIYKSGMAAGSGVMTPRAVLE